jgi:hypothetical protein
MLQDLPHAPIRTPNKRVNYWRNRYQTFMKRFPGQKPIYFSGQHQWSELPTEFKQAVGRGTTRRT